MASFVASCVEMKDWTSQEEDSSRRDQSDDVSAATLMTWSDLAALHNLRQDRDTAFKDFMATNVPALQFSIARALGMIQITLPDFQLSAQPVEIELGERAVRTADVAHGTLQNRARTHMVAFGLVMKSDRQLNHTLEVPAQRAMLRRLTPSVFEDLVGVEKAPSIEQHQAVLEIV